VVLCPTSVIETWCDELARCTPPRLSGVIASDRGDNATVMVLGTTYPFRTTSRIAMTGMLVSNTPLESYNILD
jgi:hypothetical protein